MFLSVTFLLNSLPPYASSKTIKAGSILTSSMISSSGNSIKSERLFVLTDRLASLVGGTGSL